MITKILKLSAVSAAFGAVGCFFAPASAAAAGGVLHVAGACAIGTAITVIPSGIVLSLTSIGLYASITSKNYGLAAIWSALMAAEIAACIIASAAIGGAVLEIAATSVLTCALIGMAAIAVPVLALLGLIVLTTVTTASISCSERSCCSERSYVNLI